MQADNTLVLLTRTYEDDLRGTNTATSQILTLHLYLVRRNQGYAAPEDDLRAEEVGGDRRHAAPGAFALEGSDGTRMGDEESRFLPYQRQQFVEVVGGGCPIACGDAVGRVGCCQQSELLVVDEFPLLALLDALDGESQLFLELVVGIVVKVADTGMHTDYGLQRVQ